MRTLRRHARIAGHFWRIGWIRKSQFRLEFFNQVLMDGIFYASHLLTFYVVYDLRDGASLAGWSRAEMAVLLGIVFVHDGFMMAALGQGWHFGTDLKAGALDPLRLRPGHPAFLYFFQRFSPEGFVNLFLATLIFGVAAFHAGVFDSSRAFLTVPWAIGLACWGQTAFMILGSTAEFYFTNSDLGRLFNGSVGLLTERPLDIYPSPLRRFFLYAIPAGAMSYVPASILLGRMTIPTGLAFTLLHVALGLVVVRFWRFSFRRYESALG